MHVCKTTPNQVPKTMDINVGQDAMLAEMESVHYLRAAYPVVPSDCASLFHPMHETLTSFSLPKTLLFFQFAWM